MFSNSAPTRLLLISTCLYKSELRFSLEIEPRRGSQIDSLFWGGVVVVVVAFLIIQLIYAIIFVFRP